VPANWSPRRSASASAWSSACFARASDIDLPGLGCHGAAAELSAQPLEEQRGLETIELLECSLDEPIGLTEESEQQMLGIKLVVTEAHQEAAGLGPVLRVPLL